MTTLTTLMPVLSAIVLDSRSYWFDIISLRQYQWSAMIAAAAGSALNRAFFSTYIEPYNVLYRIVVQTVITEYTIRC